MKIKTEVTKFESGTLKLFLKQAFFKQFSGLCLNLKYDSVIRAKRDIKLMALKIARHSIIVKSKKYIFEFFS